MPSKPIRISCPAKSPAYAQSAGLDFRSHLATDETLRDGLLVFCVRAPNGRIKGVC